MAHSHEASGGIPDAALCRLGIVEPALALAGAVALVLLLRLVSNRIDPSEHFFDEKVYVKMTAEGIGATRPAVAPFAYRPGAILLARAVATIGRIPPERAFAVIASVALPAFLFCLYIAVRLHGASRWRASMAVLLVGLSYSCVKRLLFNPVSPDALGLLFVALATLAAARGRVVALAVITSVGVACREFAILPSLAVALAALPAARWREVKTLAPLAPFALGVAVLVAIRLAVPVGATAQHLDPLVPSTWRNALHVFDGARLVNAVGASLTLLWPLFCLSWRPEAGASEIPGRRLPPWLKAYAIALFVAMLFSGSNFTWFAAYFGPFLAVAFAIKGPHRAPLLDLLLLVLVLVVNRTLEPIPSPRDFDAYVGHMAFYANRLDPQTGVRAFVIAAACVTYAALLRLWREGHAASGDSGAAGGSGAPP